MKRTGVKTILRRIAAFVCTLTVVGLLSHYGGGRLALMAAGLRRPEGC